MIVFIIEEKNLAALLILVEISGTWDAYLICIFYWRLFLIIIFLRENCSGENPLIY